MPPQTLDLTEEVLDGFRTIFRILATVSTSPWLELDLTMPQLKTLLVIEQEEKATIGLLAEKLGIGLPTASHLVERLVLAGLAERVEDKADRRKAITRLTPKGNDLMDRIRQVGWEPLRCALSTMDIGELKRLNEGLQVLAGLIKNNCD